MKIRIIAAAACAVIAGQANALTVAQTQAAQLKLYVAGSSALQAVIEGLLTQNCGSDYTKFKSLAGSAAGNGDSTNGNSHNIYSCTLTGSDFGSGNVGKTVAIIKREAGGSAQGVFPVATNSQVAFMDIASCTDGANTCTGTVNQLPDAGVSDIEPVAFNSAVNRPAAFGTQTVASSQYASSTAVAEQIFGLIVNDNLFNDLNSDQGTTVPSVSSSAFASIYSPGYSNTLPQWTPLLKTSTALNNQINICSRAIGSGTRATAQLLFLQSPSNRYPLSFATPANDNTASTHGNAAQAYNVSEESSSGNVVGCVGAANGYSGYAIGLVSADRDLTGTGTHFVNLDNQSPGRATAKEGKYTWVFESFYNINKSAPNLNFAKAFGSAFKLATNIAAISTAAQNGVMATPENCSGSLYSDWTSSAEQNFCSRVSRHQDSRQPLEFIK